MRNQAPFHVLATLAVGTAVFGVTLVFLALARPVDPRAALAGILAAAALTGALLGLAWARRRTLDRHPPAGTIAPPGPPALTVVPLGDGQAAVVFADSRGAPGAEADLHRSAQAEAEAIWAAVTAVTATGPATPAGPGPGIPAPRRRPFAWVRFRSRRESR